MNIEDDILIVDDEIPNLRLLTELLEKEGYRVRPAERAQTTLDSALAKPPGLILLDVRMPVMDGFVLCRRLKQDKRTKHVPVIFVSALQDTEARIQGFQAGGVDFISKPFQEQEILARVKTHLNLRQMQARLEHQNTQLQQVNVKMNWEIQERKQAEEALRDSEERFRSVFEDSGVGMVIVDRNGRYQEVNHAMSKVLGYTRQELSSMGVQDTSVPVELDQDSDIVRQIWNGEINHLNLEKRYLHKDGHVVWGNITLSSICDAEGKVLFIVGQIQDITERKQAEEALRERTEELDERVKELNCLYGISNLVEKTDISLEEIFQGIVDLIPSSWQYPEITCSRMLLEDEEYKTAKFKKTGWKQSGDIFVYGKQIGLLEVYYLEERPESEEGPFLKEERDLINAIAENLGRIIERMRARGEKERLEAQLQQTQKMEAIATLAGGIAHQFNNALTSVVGNIQLLEMDFADNKTVTGHTEAMKTSSHRMVNLTSQLLAYARGGRYQTKTMSMNNFVEDTLPIIKSNIDPSIRLETDLPRDIFSVEADPAQMQMVLSAVVSNSTEAIEGDGRISITASNEEIDSEFAKNHPELNPGKYVCLTIEDDGQGMSAETLNKIFEPFYTTKFIGRGLGMAAVYGIIQNHDGWITVDSELNKGTIIRIYLPGIEAEEIEKEVIVESATEMPKGEGTILIIEDEETVMNVIRAVLERLGYRMLEAKTGREAVEIAETFDGDIDLALLDIKLPDIFGDKVYPLIMKARPNLKVIVCSGYSIETARGILDAGAQDFIQKPFSVKELSQKLSKLLKEE